MAKRHEQAPLIPLTEEELKNAPRQLAGFIKEREEREHKKVRSEQAKEKKKLNGQISALAGQIRTQGR